MKKCITIHVLLGNIRTRFRCHKMELRGGEPPGPPPGLYHETAGGFVPPPSTQMYRAMTGGHCMLCLRHDTRPRPRRKKYEEGRGATSIGLPPHSHHATGSDLKRLLTKITNKTWLQCTQLFGSLAVQSCIVLWRPELFFVEQCFSRYSTVLCLAPKFGASRSKNCLQK